MNPLLITDTGKAFEEACTDLQKAVVAHGFGVLAIHDLGATLRDKGISFAENSRVFEVCNPHQAAQVLAADMALTVALPCRISVYTEAGHTRLAMIRPAEMLQNLSSDPELMDVAQQVEVATTAMIQEAATPIPD